MPDTDDADWIFCRVRVVAACCQFPNSSAFVGGCVGVIFSRSHIAGVLRTVSAVNPWLADRVT